MQAQAKEWGWPPETARGGERVLPQSSGGSTALLTPGFQAPGCHNNERINSYGFKLPSLCELVMAVPETSTKFLPIPLFLLLVSVHVEHIVLSVLPLAFFF